MSLPKIGFSTVIKLLIASFLVGMALAYFNIKPEDVLAQASAFAGNIAGDLGAYANSALKYVLIGAVIVLPIWFLSYVWRAIRGKD